MRTALRNTSRLLMLALALSAGHADNVLAAADAAVDPVAPSSDTSLTIVTYPLNPAKLRRVEDFRRTSNGLITEGFRKAGIVMPPGASAILNTSTRQLIVRHTKAGHKKVATWLDMP